MSQWENDRRRWPTSPPLIKQYREDLNLNSAFGRHSNQIINGLQRCCYPAVGIFMLRYLLHHLKQSEKESCYKGRRHTLV